MLSHTPFEQSHATLHEATPTFSLVHLGANRAKISATISIVNVPHCVVLEQEKYFN